MAFVKMGFFIKKDDDRDRVYEIIFCGLPDQFAEEDLHADIATDQNVGGGDIVVCDIITGELEKYEIDDFFSNFIYLTHSVLDYNSELKKIYSNHIVSGVNVDSYLMSKKRKCQNKNNKKFPNLMQGTVGFKS